MNNNKIYGKFSLKHICKGGLLLILGLTSCQDEMINDHVGDSLSLENEKFGSTIVLGKKLNNPYSLKNMQAAYDSLNTESGSVLRSGNQLQPTHYYVRFLPKDSVDFNLLERDSLDLFCYPLDYEIEQWGDFYHDPSVPKDRMTWQYTKVPVDYNFPNIQYEILEECYIPEDEESKLKSGKLINADRMEELAYEISGNKSMLKKSELKSKASPSGRFTVYNDLTGQYEGVSGIAVRMGKFVKWFHVYTDANGYYSTNSTFRTDPHYWIYFHNKKDFKIGTFSGLADARLHAMGKHSNKGYSHAFDKGTDMWAHCVVNNAAYYMHSTFENYIPQKLSYWVIDTKFSSTPMLDHGTAKNLENLAILASTLPSTVPVSEVAALSPVATASTVAFSYIAPDIFIGRIGKDYGLLYSHVIHETFHTMHFKKVGTTYWNNYVKGIILCRLKFGSDYIYGYNEKSTNYSGYIGVGETFAYAAEKYFFEKKFQKESSFIDYDYWFFPKKTWNLFNENKITPLSFLSCMDTNTTSMDALSKNLNHKNSTIPLNFYVQ